MARDPLLSSKAPTAIAPAQVDIGHVQLRDLIICPRERGVVNYVQHCAIVEHNIARPGSAPRPLAKLSFTPNTLTSLRIDGTDDILVAAGGQEAELHLSYHTPHTPRHRSGVAWRFEQYMGGSINNSVLLTSLSLARAHQSSAEPRVGISNNDCTVRFFDVPLRAHPKRALDPVGVLRLDVPVNHSSIAPDGRTLLSVGDSSKVFLHQIAGGARLSFAPIRTLAIPAPDTAPFLPSSLAASFSTAFSADGAKFAVASQEGVLVVWDVRSSKPLKVFQTDKGRVPGGNGAASGWLIDDIFDWSGGSCRAPGWSVRNVKFGGAGREVMTFTEHTSLLHIVDARTFETEEIIQVPTVARRPPSPPRAPTPPQQQPRPPLVVHRHSTSPYPSRHPPPRRPSYQAQHLVQALGDTFRIPAPYAPPPPSQYPPSRYSPPLRYSQPSLYAPPLPYAPPSQYSPPSAISDSTLRTLRRERVEEQQGGGVVVVPPMGDRGVEAEVRALLRGHGIAARLRGAEGEGGEEDPDTGSTHADFEYSPRRRRRGEVEAEAEERDGEREGEEDGEEEEGEEEGEEVPAVMPEVEYEPDLDIAGTCFDPSGGHVYVASKEAVVEWGVVGGGKRWWFGNGWV